MAELNLKRPEDAGGKNIFTGLLLHAPAAGPVDSMELPPLPENTVYAGNEKNTGKILIGGQSWDAFCGEKALWAGQPVLAAAGADKMELENWLASIKLKIRQEKTEKKPEEKIPFTPLTKGNPEKAFSSAFQIVEEEFNVKAPFFPAKSRTVTCLKDGNTYTIHTAANWPGAIRRSVSSVLKTDRKNIRVKPYPVSNAFEHCSWLPSLDACYAALLSRKVRRSVRLEIRAPEAELWNPQTPEVRFRIKGAVTHEGSISALEIHFSLETGFCFPLEKEYTDRLIMGIFSVYPCPNYTVSGTVCRSPLPPSSYGPAMGFDQGFLAGELFASRVAALSLQPPGQWRKKLLPRPGRPFSTGIPLPKDAPLPKILQTALDISDFERKNASFEQIRLNRSKVRLQPGQYKGIGISCGWFGNGFTGSLKELESASVRVTLDKEGSLTTDIPLYCVPAGIRESWCKMASDILGAESPSLQFAAELPPGNTDPGPSILGRNISVYTRLLEQALNDLSRRRFRDPLPISVTRNRRRNSKTPWNSQTLTGTPFEVISWGVSVVEISWNTVTGRVTPVHIWMAVDGGPLINTPCAYAAVENSIENVLHYCMGKDAQDIRPLIDIDFYSHSTRRRSRDITALPWLTIPPAFIQALSQTGCTCRPVFPQSFCPAAQGDKTS
ncbi:MAG: hypothetical protein CSA76_04935 [Spirochaetales bacterium]|nr:MAG: hypothetical protein CSA76_04935 [Spirochaetales bacterium]